MVFDKEFIWYEDHFVYHITTKENIESIIKHGLIPSLGERSLSKMDINKAIYFFDNINNFQMWAELLYPNIDIKNLELLRFNLKRRKWYIHNGGEDFYLLNKVPPQKIQYLDDAGQINGLHELNWKNLVLRN